MVEGAKHMSHAQNQVGASLRAIADRPDQDAANEASESEINATETDYDESLTEAKLRYNTRIQEESS